MIVAVFGQVICLVAGACIGSGAVQSLRGQPAGVFFVLAGVVLFGLGQFVLLWARRREAREKREGTR